MVSGAVLVHLEMNTLHCRYIFFIAPPWVANHSSPLISVSARAGEGCFVSRANTNFFAINFVLLIVCETSAYLNLSDLRVVSALRTSTVIAILMAFKAIQHCVPHVHGLVFLINMHLVRHSRSRWVVKLYREGEESIITPAFPTKVIQGLVFYTCLLGE